MLLWPCNSRLRQYLWQAAGTKQLLVARSLFVLLHKLTWQMECLPLARSQRRRDPSSLPVTIARIRGKTPKQDISLSPASLRTKEQERLMGSQLRSVLSRAAAAESVLVLLCQ